MEDALADTRKAFINKQSFIISQSTTFAQRQRGIDMYHDITYHDITSSEDIYDGEMRDDVFHESGKLDQYIYWRLWRDDYVSSITTTRVYYLLNNHCAVNCDSVRKLKGRIW